MPEEFATVTDREYEYHTVYREVDNLQRSRQAFVNAYREYQEEVTYINTILVCANTTEQHRLLLEYIDLYNEEDEIETIEDLRKQRNLLVESMNKELEAIGECDAEYDRLRARIEATDVG
ncbi:MAG: hypothetical protein Kow00121_30300 [Elainellaceae cyanobacterium]